MSIRSTYLCKPQGNSSAPQLSIERADFDEVIRYAVAAGKNEVCGFAFVRKHSACHFSVIPGSVFITTQLTGPGAAQPDALGEVEVINREEMHEEADIFRLLWHSHVGGAAIFSSTDLNTHDTIAQSTGLDAMFFMVVNNRGQAAANVEQYQPIRIGTQLLLAVLDEVPHVDLEPYKTEINAKRRPFPAPPKPAAVYPSSLFGDEDDGFELDN